MIRIQPTFLFQIGILAGVFGPFLAAQVNGGRSILRAREFIENPSLLAHARQTVLIDNDPNPFEEPVIRYELEEGPHNFCLNRKQTYVTGMALEDISGNQVFKMPSQGRCARVVLPGGIYQLRFSHSDQREPHSNRSARLEVDPPSPPLVDPNGNPVSGYWAVQPDPAGDPQHRLGRVRAQGPFKDIFNDPYLYAPVVADYNSRQIDDFSLFRLRNSNLPAILGVPTTGKQTIWTAGDVDTGEGLFILNDAAGCGDVYCEFLYYSDFKLTDLGNQKFQFGSVDRLYGISKTQYSNSQLGFSFDEKKEWPFPVLELLFRFFPDGSQIGALRPGEAGLFQSCGYGGKTAIFALGISDLSALDSSTITIDNSAKSIRLGNNTAVLWRTASSQLTAITADTACLPAGSAEPGGHDFEVLPLDTLLSDSGNGAALDKKCINCKLQGVDLANLNLEGWNFSGADLSGATLTNVKLRNGGLDGAILAGTKLSCVDFSGIDQNHPTDLTSVDFSKVQWIQTNGCKSNFSYTLLSVTKLPPSLWKYVNVSYATFVDAKGQQLSSEARRLDLSGVTLAGISLEGAVLDYATGLAGADLTQAVLRGASLQHVNLSGGAKLNITS